MHQNDQSLNRASAVLAVVLVGTLFISLGRGRAETPFLQSSETFEKAIRIRTTHTYVVFATIVNDVTGESHTQCVPAPLLLGAIHKEYDLKYDAPSMEKAIQIALANPSREFHFSKQAAIDNIPLSGKEKGDHLEDRRQYQRRLQQACVLVRGGNLVFLADITGQISVDRTK